MPVARTFPPPAAIAEEVRETGAAVVPAAFTAAELADARRTVLAHLHLLRNTRPTPSSRHLAGFHRFPELEPLHLLLTRNPRVIGHLRPLLGERIRTIGLSDVTVNRSQQWHKDLLRGPYRTALDAERVCERHHGRLFKVIAYLQASDSLHFVPGSHRADVPLDSDEWAVPAASEPISRVHAAPGDAVIIDVCTTHRGSTEDAFADAGVAAEPRILVSTVFGAAGCEFADRMEAGNAVRLADWGRRHP